MKKQTIFNAGLAFVAFGLISWGFKGHRAETHERKYSLCYVRLPER
jgi:hypothetical protein